MARPRKNPADKKTKSVTRVKKLKDLLTGQTTPQEAENRRHAAKSPLSYEERKEAISHIRKSMTTFLMKYLKVSR